MDLGTMVRELGTGMLITTEIFVLTLVFSLPLGMVLAFGRMSRLKVLSFLTKLYISIMRGTPLMLQLIVVYFAPYYVFGMKISKSYRMIAVILAFVLNYAAYFAEIYRSGIESMPVGQYEAAKVLGYSRVPDIFQDYFAAGHQAGASGSDQRNDHTGKGYIPGLCADSNGDVYDCKADRGSAGFRNAFDGSRSILLHF